MGALFIMLVTIISIRIMISVKEVMTMRYDDLQKIIVDKAIIKKFQKDTSTPEKLREYFKVMVDNFAQPLLEIDLDFYKYSNVGSYADNYEILDCYLIVNGTSEKKEVDFKYNTKTGTEEFLKVTFVEGIPFTDGRELTKQDLEQYLIVALK